MTPFETAGQRWLASLGVDRENDDPGFCDSCDEPLWPGTCGLCATCCGTDDDEEYNRDRLDDR